MESFADFVSTVFGKDDPLATYFEAFTTVSMCNRNTRQKIHDTRKTWIINNFVEYKNIDTEEYSKFYDNNIIDSYSGVFAPPPCPVNTEEKEENEIYHEDDIDIHYKEIASKYDNISNLQQNNKKDEDEISYCTEYESDYSQDNGYNSLTEFTDFEDYDEIDDYYEEDIYFEDDYDY
jgi:hypothetical protein